MRENRLPSPGPARTAAIMTTVTTLENARRWGSALSPGVPVSGGPGRNGRLCSTPGSLKVWFQDHLQEGPLGYLLKCRFLSPGSDLVNRISHGQGLHFNTFSKLFYCKIIENRCSRPQATHGPESSDSCQEGSQSEHSRHTHPRSFQKGRLQSL